MGVFGKRYLSKGRFKKAETEYRKAILIDPALTTTHVCPAMHCTGRAGKGDLDGAIAAFTQALSLEPKHVLTHFNLGGVLDAKGDLDCAIAASPRTISRRSPSTRTTQMPTAT